MAHIPAECKMPSGDDYLIPHGLICKIEGRFRPGGEGDEELFKASKFNDDMLLDWEFTVLEGEFIRKKFWQAMPINCGGEKEIRTKSILRAMVDSANGLRGDDYSEHARALRKFESETELDGIIFASEIIIEPGTNGFQAKNKLGRVVPADCPEWHAVMVEGRDIVPSNVVPFPQPPAVPVSAATTPSASPTDAIDRINAEYAFVLVGGKSTIIRETHDDDGRPLTIFMGKDAFHDWFAPEFVTMKDGNRKPASKVWWTDSRRRRYSGLVFAPEGASDRFYNMWRGFPVQPKQGKCNLFLSHVHDNICKGDTALFKWLEAWMAQMFQQPHKKPGTCIVLRGRHGTGKSKVGDVLRRMTYPHDTKISKGRHLTGNFNAHLKHTLFLQVEEGFWAGDKAAEGVLKDLITSDEQQLEMKGKDVESIRNLMRVLITSNHDWVVPAAMDERRFAILDVGDDHRKDYAYFKAIDDQLDNGGREALLHHFLHLDINGINLREVPQTQGLVEQKLRSMTPEQSWWFDCLERGSIVCGSGDWPEWIATDTAYQSYVDHADSVGVRFRHDRPIFTRDHWKKIAPGIQARREASIYGYDIPSLPDCRAAFERIIGGNIDWPEE